MEWVEVTGKTIEAAKEAALEQLGVAEADAELIVLDEPRSGLFGRVRGEARVRARVRPVGARPKRTRRPRERDERARSSTGGRSRSPRPAESNGRREGTAEVGPEAGSSGERHGSNGTSPGLSRSAKRRRARARAKTGAGAASAAGTAEPTEYETRARAERGESREDMMAEGMTLQEQGDAARDFVKGLIDELGLEADVSTRLIDEETVEVAAKGEGLGILVGPKGSTLAALQDVTRTVVQRQFTTKTDRILVDVAGYREKRAAALQRFSQQVANEVIETGAERALEPMSPPDRKVVHDAVNAIEGVSTRSEGEEPARYIVIAPQG